MPTVIKEQPGSNARTGPSKYNNSFLDCSLCKCVKRNVGPHEQFQRKWTWCEVAFVVPCSFEGQHRGSFWPWLDTAQISVHVVWLSHPKVSAFPTHQTWYNCGWDPSENQELQTLRRVSC
jgi:hypothetical protein